MAVEGPKPSTETSDQIQEMIDYREEHIERAWRRFAGGVGDESGELQTAVEAAVQGLQPLKQIAALEPAVQDQVVASLGQRGLAVGQLYDERLFDDAARACARVRLRREAAALRTPWPELWRGASVVNALGEAAEAAALVGGRCTALCLAAAGSPECQAFASKLMDFHRAVVREQKAPLQIVLVPFEESDGAALKGLTKPFKGSPRPAPWPALLPSQAAHGAVLDRVHSALAGLPSLLVFAPDGTLLTNSGRADVEAQGASAWDTWQEQQQRGVAWSLPQIFDPFADPALQVSEACSRARDAGGSGHNVLLHVGANWSHWCVSLHQALQQGAAAAAVAAHFELVPVSFETSKRWLKEAVPGVQHWSAPRLLVLTPAGALVAEADALDLLQAPPEAAPPDCRRDYDADALLAFLHSAAPAPPDSAALPAS